MDSDETLIAEYRRGSRQAFEELFARYREPMYGFFRRRLDSRERAEDLTQETFLAVIRGAARWEPRALVRTWLYGIALKLLYSERRKLKRTGPPADLAAGGSPENAMWVRQALAKLGETEREILMLREYEQLDYAEIADLLRIPVNTVRSRLFRARMAMRDCLKGEASHV